MTHDGVTSVIGCLMAHRPLILLLGLLLLSLSGPAAAQEGGDAAALFDRGLEEMLDGDYASGCPNLAKSYQLEPLAGVMFTLAECYAKWDKLATALEHYRKYLDLVPTLPEDKQARQAERMQVASEQYAVLEPQIPTLTILLPRDAPADVAVELDGQELAPNLISVAHRLDPGIHDVIIRRPTGESRAYRENLAKGNRRILRVELPASDTPPVVAPPDDSLGPMRVAALVTGGVGVAALIVGSITGGMALGETDAIDSNCVDTQCNQTGLDAAEGAQTLATVSTVGFVIGGLGLATGAVLWFTAPGDSPADEDSGPSTRAAIGATFGPAGATLGLRVPW